LPAIQKPHTICSFVRGFWVLNESLLPVGRLINRVEYFEVFQFQLQRHRHRTLALQRFNHRLADGVHIALFVARHIDLEHLLFGLALAVVTDVEMLDLVQVAEGGVGEA